jgi:hypothetical protein
MSILRTTWDDLMAPSVHEAGHGVRTPVRRHGRPSSSQSPGTGTGDASIKAYGPLMDVLAAVAGRGAEERYCEIVGDCPADRRPMHSDVDDSEGARESAKKLTLGDIGAARKLV